MRFILGVITVFGCVAGGYAMHHGKFAVLWQPNEVVIIVGSAIGAMMIGNPGPVLKGLGSFFGQQMRGVKYKKPQYVELLTFLFNTFKIMKSKGLLEIEKDIEDPHASELFNNYPSFAKDHHAVDFFCDHVRLLTMGVDNQYQMDDLMTAELDTHHHEQEEIAGAMVTFGESFPALGIVAAVLGVIQTMGSISEPPEVLGGLIGAALVGTFLGILLSYGLVAPIGQFMGKYAAAESKYMGCVKSAILAHMQGNAPAISVEFARKEIPNDVRPTFKEIEEAINSE